MPTPPKKSPRKLTDRVVAAALQETLRGERALPSADRLLERWRAVKAATPADVIPFAVEGDMAMAARNGGAISKTSRTRMADLVRQMKKEKDRDER